MLKFVLDFLILFLCRLGNQPPLTMTKAVHVTHVRLSTTGDVASFYLPSKTRDELLLDLFGLRRLADRERDLDLLLYRGGDLRRPLISRIRAGGGDLLQGGSGRLMPIGEGRGGLSL